MIKKSTFKKNYQTLVLLAFFLGIASIAHSQQKIGKNRTITGVSSLLELEHPAKCLVLNTVADTALITSPKEGMMIYHKPLSGTPAIRVYQAGKWAQLIVFDNKFFLRRKYTGATA